MNVEQKIKYYEVEYNYIKDEKKKEDLKTLVGLLPEYYFEMPASTTGKYHPKFASTKNGLVKHTKLATRLAYELLNNEITGSKFSDNEKDLIIMAIVMHDGLKCGDPKEKYTRFDHPLLVSKLIMENKDKISLNTEELRNLCSMIETHMGQWTYDTYNKKEVLPKPVTEMQRFVHMCDFLSSKKFLNADFDGYNLKY